MMELAKSLRDPVVQQFFLLPFVAALVIPVALGIALGRIRRGRRGAFVGLASTIITLALIPVIAGVIDIFLLVDDPFIYLAVLPALVALLFVFIGWSISAAVDRLAPIPRDGATPITIPKPQTESVPRSAHLHN